MRKKTSLKDIAEKVGVSTALVSYVLNNQKTGRIRKEVAERIRAMAKELNYSFNHIAKSLKTNRTNTIGVIVSDISNPFSSSLARIIEDEAEKYNYTVLFGSSDENGDKMMKLVSAFLNKQVDGLILAPAQDARLQIEKLIEQEVPFVLIDRIFPGLKTSYIAIDNFEASLKATTHLLEQGFKKIGMVIFDTSLSNIIEREYGYREALSRQSIPVADEWVQRVSFKITEEEISQAVHKLVSGDAAVDAIFFASNRITSAGLKVIIRKGLKVPEQLAVVSFDQVEGADFFYCPLTYVRQPLSAIGQNAADALFKMIGKDQEMVEVKLEAELIIGRSSIRQ